MKKLMPVALATFTLSLMALYSCNKTADSTTSAIDSSASSCKTSVFLLPDSFYNACNKSIIYNQANGRDFAINNSIPAIDTITKGAKFLVNYDSVGTLACNGRIFTLVNVTCFTKQ